MPILPRRLLVLLMFACLARPLAADAVLESQRGHTLALRVAFTDQLGEKHTRLRHSFKGVRVWGSEATVHLDPEGRRLPDAAPAPDLALAFEAAPGTTIIRALPIRLRLEPSVSLGQAHQLIRHRLGRFGSTAVFLGFEKVIYPVYHSLVPTPPTDRPLNAADVERVLDGHRLAWLIRTEIPHGEVLDYLVDAHSGELLERIPVDPADTPAKGTGQTSRWGDVTLDTTGEDPAGSYKLVDSTRGKGGPFGGNAVTAETGPDAERLGQVFTNRTNVWGNHQPRISGSTGRDEDLTTAADAAYSLQCAWDYFLNIHGRRGWDGLGTPVAVKLNAGADDRKEDNASWILGTRVIRIGAGRKDLPRTGFTTVAHELTHGVTDATADLVYAGESGGLNEATSDIFSKMAETYALKHRVSGPAIGEPDSWDLTQIQADTREPKLMRSLSQPSRDGASPDAWTERLKDLDPHYASGPMNRAFYFLAEGMTNAEAVQLRASSQGQGMKGLGTDKAAAIWYRALAVYLKPGSTYLDARIAAIQAARDLFPDSPGEARAVRMAFAAINVGSPEAGTEAPPAPPEVTATLAGGELTLRAAGPSIAAVTYAIDGAPVGTVGSDPYALTLDTPRLLANGLHRWYAHVTYGDGSSRQVPGRPFTLANPVQQLLKDPGFGTRGPEIWGRDRRKTLPSAREPATFPGGQGSAVFLDLPGEDANLSLSQKVTIPAGTRWAALKLRALITASAELPEVDQFGVRVSLPGYARGRTLEVGTLAGTDAWEDWLGHTFLIQGLGDPQQDRTVTVTLDANILHDDARFRIGEVKLLCSAAPLLDIAVIPRRLTLAPGASALFKAEVLNATDHRITWTLREPGAGTLTPEGAYTAPTEPGTYHAIATAMADPKVQAEISIKVR